ncbi:hypothetical protein [Nocardioides cavernaquae]|nr:hypothetical protein [Nocardioides cavernaquae]
MWDVVGWGGSALVVLSLLQARVLRFRVLNLIACGLLVAFNSALEVWPMVALNVVLCSVNAWFVTRLLRERHDSTAFEVLQVKPDDTYLLHVLEVHAADIARFQPDFDAAGLGSTSGCTVYLVQKGDETLGVVVLEIQGDTAEVRLDYVTRKYRDFSPGEFVWRRSGMLATRGVRHVLTSPRMVNAYYGNVGFRREGDSWVLDT